MPGYRLPPVPANVRWSMSLLDRVAAKRKRTHSRAVAARLWTGFRSGKKKKEKKKKKRPSAGNNNFNRHPDQTPRWLVGVAVGPSHMHAFARAFARCRRYALAETEPCLTRRTRTHTHMCIHTYTYTHSIPGERKTRAPTTFGFGDRRRRIPRARAGGTRIAAGDTPSFREIPLRLGAST